MLIYTGCRIGELLDLKKENVNLEERYFKIVASKTAAGIRTAPISEKVHPFFEYWYNLNDLATYGDNLADAFAMAQEACGQYLFTSLRDGEVLPAPTPIDAVEKDEDAALVNLICVNLDEYARAYNDKAVKKTLSIPAWLNTACENYGINYSKVLQDALIAKLQAHS